MSKQDADGRMRLLAKMRRLRVRQACADCGYGRHAPIHNGLGYRGLGQYQGHAFKEKVNGIATEKFCCQLGDLKSGLRIIDSDGETEHLITDAEAREGFMWMCQMDTGTMREFPTSARIEKGRIRLRFVANIIG